MAIFDHWMRFHVGDYLADTMHLSALQHGVYLLLIMHYFKRGELPNDAAALRRIAKLSARQWRTYSPAVMALFRVSSTGSLCHPRIDQERAFAASISETRRQAGKLGAASKWGRQMPSDDDGKSDGKRHGKTRPRARDSTTTTTNKPPRNPPDNGGVRTRGNAFNDTTAEMIDAEATGAREQGPAVVFQLGRAHRR